MVRSWKRYAATLAACGVLSMGSTTANSQQSAPPAVPPAVPTAVPAAAPPGAPPSGPVERLEWLKTGIETAIAARPALRSARIGIEVREHPTGAILYQRLAGERFNVASNAKLVTAATALATLGSAFRFRTHVAAEKLEPDGTVPGDLYIQSYGDPTLLNSHLDELVQALVRVGVRRVRGRLIVDDSFFDTKVMPPHFSSQPEEQGGFRAPISAASVNYNTVRVRIAPSPTGSGPARVEVVPPQSYVKVLGSLQTVRHGRTRIAFKSAPKPGNLEITVGGQVRVERAARWFRVRIDEPALYLGELFRSALKRQGIAVRNHPIKRGTVPAQAKVLAHHTSRPLATILRAMGKYSNNFVAESVLKTLGARTLTGPPRPATWQDGLAAVREHLESRVGLAPDSYRMDNGSGLFNASEFTPGQICDIITAAVNDLATGADFLSALSIGGVDGTLRRRLGAPETRGRVRAKTGTLDPASALSGVIVAAQNRSAIFSIVINRSPKLSARHARALQDRILTLVGQYLAR